MPASFFSSLCADSPIGPLLTALWLQSVDALRMQVEAASLERQLAAAKLERAELERKVAAAALERAQLDAQRAELEAQHR